MKVGLREGVIAQSCRHATTPNTQYASIVSRKDRWGLLAHLTIAVNLLPLRLRGREMLERPETARLHSVLTRMTGCCVSILVKASSSISTNQRLINGHAKTSAHILLAPGLVGLLLNATGPPTVSACRC
jgi:hypothetical protein